MRPTITKKMVKELVAAEYRQEPITTPPLDPILMAWPFKTDEERAALGKWFAKESRAIKSKNLKQLGESIL